MASRFQMLAIDLHGLPCLVVGGGKVGTRKAAILCRAGAKLTVVSPEILPALRDEISSTSLCWIAKPFASAMLDGQRLVIAATNDAALNQRIADEAERRGIFCCNVSEAGRSRVLFPAVHVVQEMTVAVHSDGCSCNKSRALRDRIADWLNDENE